ncbi:MAG: superoxide dismutase [Thermoflexales bacterium]|nr:superoxide dismutase [Thermoflexales bacterium]
MAYELPPLPYPYEALEPYIDAQTMQIHHGKHHGGYVTNLNNAVKDYPELAAKSPEELIRDLSALPEGIRTAVRNNGGGHVNHAMFWQQLKVGVPEPTSGALYDAIVAAFGSMEAMKDAFEKAGLARFGSGWVWLVVNKDGKLEIMSTPNQDNPMMAEYGGLKPILGVDVWEHAYYLKYQNRRADYLKAIWNVVNWDDVAHRFST